MLSVPSGEDQEQYQCEPMEMFTSMYRKIAGTSKVKSAVLANRMTGEQVLLSQFGWIVPFHLKPAVK